MSSLDFDLVSAEITFPSQEEEVLKYWDEKKAFETSLKQSLEEKRPEFTFYDGPPFATGLPHYGHILAGTIKDVVTRYAHQTGFHVSRRFGWDTHGLPVEYEIDKKLGIKSKDDVMKMGIDKYNAECRSIVMRYAEEWEQRIGRMGRWIDFKNDYKTLNPTFMESVWWVFKTMFEKGLVYQGFKVMPYSTGCHTPLSNFESGTDCYKDVQDPAVVVSFPVVGNEEMHLLAWTTTPWTLPSNLALCVNVNFDYVKIKDKVSGKIYVLAESCLGTLYKQYKPAGAEDEGAKKETKKKKKNKKKKPAADENKEAANEKPDTDEAPFELIEKLKGKDLVGLSYQPLFEYFRERTGGRAWRVVSDDYVTEGSGTGIVHQAPAFGEDDYRVCLREGIIERGGDLICPVDDSGEFTDEVPDFKGLYVKKADRQIINRLKKEGRLVVDSNIKHPYPHCWRSDTPLIYKAVPSWFVNVPKIKDKLLANNEKTYWVPAFVQEKRFHNWLKDAQDWSVSRDRFWGTPIPIWISDDGEEVVVIGSIQELKDKTGCDNITDLHRDKIDHLTIPSAQGKGDLKRVPQVFDCWFESGSMPYAQVHYPFENKERFEQHQFPADFIAEGLDQTRGWFYTLMVISTALFDKPAFKNLIVNGLVLAEDGRKMSKRLQNYPDPVTVVNKYGADALRLYLINSPVVRAEPLKFKEEGVRDVVKDLFVPWNNTYRFFVEQHRRFQMNYAGESLNLDPEAAQAQTTTDNAMDKWILASLQSLIKFVRDEMKAYRLYTVIPRLVDFISDLSNWYLRFNKGRLKGDNGIKDARNSLCTVYEVLLNLCKLMAPFTPFLVESMYQNLKKGLPADKRVDSVHYLMVPEPNSDAIDENIERAVAHMRSVIDMGRVARDKSGISFRVPVQKLTVVNPDPAFLADVKSLSEYVQNDLNARELVFSSDVNKFGHLKAAPDRRAIGQKWQKNASAVMKQVSKLSAEQVAKIDKDGSVTVTLPIDGKDSPVDITREDVNLQLEFTGDAKTTEVQTDIATGTLVLLDKTLNDDCVDEGLAREFMSRVQQLRKTSGLNSEDEVEVFYSLADGSANLSRVLTSKTDFINSGIRIYLQHLDKAPQGYEQLADGEFEVNKEGGRIVIYRQKLIFRDHVGADVREAAWKLEASAGRLKLRAAAAEGGFTVQVNGKDHTLKEGEDFHFCFKDVNAQ